MPTYDPEVAVEELLRHLRQRLAAFGGRRIAAVILGALLTQGGIRLPHGCGGGTMGADEEDPCVKLPLALPATGSFILMQR